MDGIEAAGKIKSFLNIPIIYLTAYSDKKTIQRAKITTPFGYILKPFSEQEIHTTIEMALYKHKTDLALKESEEWFRSVINASKDAIIAADTQGAIIFVNPAAELLFSKPREEFENKRITSLLEESNPLEPIPIRARASLPAPTDYQRTPACAPTYPLHGRHFSTG